MSNLSNAQNAVNAAQAAIDTAKANGQQPTNAQVQALTDAKAALKAAQEAGN